MSTDPRAILDHAARARTRCKLKTRGTEWSAGWFVRVETAGVLAGSADLKLVGGEDLRVWFSWEGQAYTFSATVLRAGLPLPDRSNDGAMLGFIQDWEHEDTSARAASGLQIEVLPAKGKGIALLGGDARLVELGPSELVFAVPTRVALKFMEGGRVRVRFTAPSASQVVFGRVRRLSPDGAHMLYALAFDEVPDPDLHLRAVEAFKR
jgi:hypothetical protein